MPTWLPEAHIVGTLTWGVGLLWCALRLPREDPSHDRRGRAAYRFFAAPGAFLSFYTGVWMLHQNPALLQERSLHLKLVLVFSLFAVDHLCMRGVHGERAVSSWRRRLLQGATVVGFGGAAALGALAMGGTA